MNLSCVLIFALSDPISCTTCLMNHSRPLGTLGFKHRMSSSDSEEETRLPPRPAEDSDDDSGDEKPKVLTRAAAGAGPAKAAAGSDDDDDSSDDDVAAVPVRRPGAQGDSGSDSDGDSDTEAKVPQRRQVALWVPIDYDAMTEEEFYELLKEKTREQRLEEKRMADENARQQQERAKALEPFIDDQTTGYSYQTMLQRIFQELRANNPELGDGTNKKVKLPVPKIEKSGSKKTALTNFRVMCQAMNRPMELVKDFIEKHLTTTSSVDANDCLIVKIQNVKQLQIEAVFQKYVEEFCQCGNCGGIETDLTRDPSSRLWIMKCKTCQAGRTVQAASGATYQATTTKRSRLRNKI